MPLLLLLAVAVAADMLGLLAAVEGGEGVREMTEEAAFDDPDDDRVDDEASS
jgi:hypothetical protein